MWLAGKDCRTYSLTAFVVEYQFFESAIAGYAIADYKNSLTRAFATKTEGTALTSTSTSLPLSPAKTVLPSSKLCYRIKNVLSKLFRWSAGKLNPVSSPNSTWIFVGYCFEPSMLMAKYNLILQTLIFYMLSLRRQPEIPYHKEFSWYFNVKK